MRKTIIVLILISLLGVSSAEGYGKSPSTTSAKADGYHGIWYEIGWAYSGGFAFFCAKHTPFAVYSPKAKKTFFVYGGTKPGTQHLQAMASYYDHQHDVVPRPTIVHDWGSSNAHMNPTVALDGDGHVWVFVSGHGGTGYKYRSVKPYSMDNFEQVAADPMTYPQPWWVPRKGFLLLFTKYENQREQFWSTSADGRNWTAAGQLTARSIGNGYGNYQISTRRGDRVATAINSYVDGQNRSNLYYLQTDDMGETWQTADGTTFTTPITKLNSPALAHDFWSEKRLVYLKDINFDREGRPVILVLTAPAGQTDQGAGGPRTWTIVHWLDDRWELHKATTSTNNFDTGSLYIEDDGTWRIIGPTEPGPQHWAAGGEIAMWTSEDRGKTWKKVKQLTTGSKYNHSYVRRPVDAHPDFYALWADGHGKQPSESRIYFCDKQGKVRVLPQEVKQEFVRPETLGDRGP